MAKDLFETRGDAQPYTAELNRTTVAAHRLTVSQTNRDGLKFIGTSNYREVE